LKNPDSPDFQECPDFFPESLGFILQNPKSQSRTPLSWLISHFHIFLLIQMVRVKVRRETEEPSTQRRTKARHDPAALRAVQEELGQGGSQRSSRPRRGDPPPSYAKRSEEEIEEEEEERTESDGVEEDETYEQPPDLLVAMGRGQLERKPATSLTPKRATKPPMSIKVVLLLAFHLNTRKE
jgi:hypothetical protein